MQHSTCQVFELPAARLFAESAGLPWNQCHCRCLPWSCRRSPESQSNDNDLTVYVQAGILTCPPVSTISITSLVLRYLTKASRRDVFWMRPMPTGTERADQERPMDHQLPSLQSETGLISTDGQVLLASTSFAVDSPGDSYSMQASILRRQLLQRKGSRTPEQFQPSTLSIRAVSFSQCSYNFSFTNHTIESVVYNSQLHPLAFSESSFQTHRVSRWHRHQPDRRSATSYSHRQSEVRGISHRFMALGANAVTTAFRPTATDARDNQLRSLPGSKMVASLSDRASRREAYPLFSFSHKICHF